MSKILSLRDIKTKPASKAVEPYSTFIGDKLNEEVVEELCIALDYPYLSRAVRPARGFGNNVFATLLVEYVRLKDTYEPEAEAK